MKPDLIVGIDLGMTFTGAAYYSPSKASDGRVSFLQTWPGKEDKTENKVPTSLIYHGDKLMSWGFLCDHANRPDYPNPKRQQFFKLFLDSDHLSNTFPDGRGPSHSDVKKWFTDYLKKLYQHIKQEFSEGFKTKKTRNFFIGLTEAEAAAIYTFKSEALSLNIEDVILVCDAGGGKTDVAMLEGVGQSNEPSQLRQINFDLGKSVGSVKIDQEFAQMVEERLHHLEEKLSYLADEPDWAYRTAWEMAQGQFQYYKCAFGKPEGTFNSFRIKIPDLSWNGDCAAASVSKKHMTFTKKFMRELFDTQLEREDDIFSIIDAQLNDLRNDQPAKQVDYLTLSGGLGSSCYIKKALCKRYLNQPERYPNTEKMKLITAERPQLAVVQGLVTDQVQRNKHGGRAVLKSRTSPANYGVLCQKLYDEVEHIGLKDIEIDELDGKRYITNLIHWFVKRGDPIPGDEPITYQFMRKIAPDDKLRGGIWKITVVISYNERDDLPRQLSENAQALCEVVSDTSRLDFADFEKISTKWWQLNKSKKHYIARYDVSVVIGVTDIIFEVHLKGEKLSKDQPILVEWQEGAKMSGPLSKPRDIYVKGYF